MAAITQEEVANGKTALGTLFDIVLAINTNYGYFEVDIDGGFSI